MTAERSMPFIVTPWVVCQAVCLIYILYHMWCGQAIGDARGHVPVSRQDVDDQRWLMGVTDRPTRKNPEYRRGTASGPLPRLAFAVGKADVKATRDIIEVPTPPIVRRRPNGTIRRRFRAGRVRRPVEGGFRRQTFRMLHSGSLIGTRGFMNRFASGGIPEARQRERPLTFG